MGGSRFFGSGLRAGTPSFATGGSQARGRCGHVRPVRRRRRENGGGSFGFAAMEPSRPPRPERSAPREAAGREGGTSEREGEEAWRDDPAFRSAPRGSPPCCRGSRRASARWPARCRSVPGEAGTAPSPCRRAANRSRRPALPEAQVPFVGSAMLGVEWGRDPRHAGRARPVPLRPVGCPAHGIRHRRSARRAGHPGAGDAGRPRRRSRQAPPPPRGRGREADLLYGQNKAGGEFPSSTGAASPRGRSSRV